jgi:hypothetical protein
MRVISLNFRFIKESKKKEKREYAKERERK